jgi:hypothetical protein
VGCAEWRIGGGAGAPLARWAAPSEEQRGASAGGPTRRGGGEPAPAGRKRRADDGARYRYRVLTGILTGLIGLETGPVVYAGRQPR